MDEEIPLYVQRNGQELRWKMTVEGDGPWRLRLESSDGVEATATGDNVFEALRAMRPGLTSKGVAVCCHGARVDVRPSGLSASHGAWMVYVLRLWRPPTVRDLVPTFGYCPAELTGSPEEQDAYWEKHLKSRKNWFNFINPVWWIYLLTASWGRPKRLGLRHTSRRHSDTPTPLDDTS
ncbi:hypothetical protein [Streptomyces malaysiensis]|uniref:hypothetical protein n=1 Tax=Streptomyces malaysiensis TaxID=92644 RepID=UPI0011CE6A72|nr:hypothetical protein [Streptomyces malaysiensis]